MAKTKKAQPNHNGVRPYSIHLHLVAKLWEGPCLLCGMDYFPGFWGIDTRREYDDNVYRCTKPTEKKATKQ